MRQAAILLIDDDPGICDVIRAVLEPEGFTVQTASNGEEGLALLRRIRNPCLILLDLMMPVMDGWEFLRRKRDDPSIAQLPLVVITAFGKHDQLPPGFDVIYKPFQLDALLAIVVRYCGKGEVGS